MNNIQEEYIRAKAAFDVVSEEETAFEINFCKEKGYGRRQIQDLDEELGEEKLNQVFDELSELKQKSGLWARVCNAREAKLAAEEKLIEFALSIVSLQKERETLKNAAKTNWRARQQIIDLALKLDMPATK